MHAVARTHVLALLVACVGACNRSESKTDDQPRIEAAPEPEYKLPPTVEIRIVSRKNVEGGVEHRISALDRRATLYAAFDTPLAAATEANEQLTLELAPGLGGPEDHAGGAIELAGETRRVVAFDGWFLPADTISHGSLVGVWRVPEPANEVRTDEGLRRPVMPHFAYDGHHVVVVPKGETEIHKLESRWTTDAEGHETLQFRAPSGAWETIAALALEGRARRFVLAEPDRTWPLERVRKPNDAAPAERPLAADRPLHQYANAPG